MTRDRLAVLQWHRSPGRAAVPWVSMLPSGTMDCPAVPWTAQQNQGLLSNTRGHPATTRGRPATTKGRPATTRGRPATTKGRPATTRGRTATPGAAQQRQGPHINTRGRTATPGAAQQCQGPHSNAWGRKAMLGAIQQYQAPFGSMNLVRNDLLTTLGICGQLASTVGLVSVCGAAHLNI